MGNQVMGFEGDLLYGVAGATGATLLQNCKDITVSGDFTYGNTTVRGNGVDLPIETEQPTAITLGIEFVMLNDKTDTALEALKAAAATGAAVALRGKDYAAGKGPDGDFTVSASKPWPLAGEQVITFTAKPTRSAGRTPQVYI